MAHETKPKKCVRYFFLILHTKVHPCVLFKIVSWFSFFLLLNEVFYLQVLRFSFFLTVLYLRNISQFSSLYTHTCSPTCVCLLMHLHDMIVALFFPVITQAVYKNNSKIHILSPCKYIRLLFNINTELGKHCTPSFLITMQLMYYFIPTWDYFHLSH